MKGLAHRRGVEAFALSSSEKSWVRQESVMTQTSPSIGHGELPFKTQSSQDDPDLLEVLSLCEGATDEFDLNEDDEFSDERKLERSHDSSSCAKSSSAERDDDSDVVLRHRVDTRLSSASSLPPAHCSTKSLATRSESETNGSSTIQRRPFGLQLTHEPFQNIVQLPSPSSASLHSGHGHIVMQELTTKSNSAPILLKKERKRDDFASQPMVSIERTSAV